MDIKQKIIDYVSENIIKASSFIFLLFGGLVFFIYYLDIKYLPDLNLINSVQLLAFASLTGILLVLSTIAMLIFPGLFWQKTIYGNEIIAKAWSDKLLRILVIFIIPIVFFYLSFITYISKTGGLININNIWVVSLNLLWIISLYIWGMFKPKIQNVTWLSFSINYFKCIGFAAYGSLVSILPILLLDFTFLEEYQKDIKTFAISCLFLTIYIIISNIIVIGKPENVNSIYWFFTSGLISLLFVITFTNQAARFPKAIMKTYKLGNIEASSIVIDKQGCNTINKLMKFHQVKNPSNGKLIQFEIEDDSCIIPNVNILSKIGKEAYIEFDEISIKIKNEEYKTMRFVIPSSSIVTYNLIK